MALVADVVKGFASDSAKSLLTVIISRIGKEVALAWEFKDDLGDLEKKLKRLDTILAGAPPEVFTDQNKPFVVDWLKQVREVAYQAEDVMDEYSYELLKRKIALKNRPQCLHRCKTNIRFFFSMSSNPVVFRFPMAHKVKSLKESIDKIYAEALRPGIGLVEVAYDGKVLPGRDHYTRDDPCWIRRERPDDKALIGRDSDKDIILGLLRDASNSDKLLSVIGISGMAGLGKTALCQDIFKIMEEKGEYFEKQIWICVSRDCNFVRLLNAMIRQLEKQEFNIPEIATLEKMIQDRLQGRKYLLVLDDVWGTFVQIWESMRSSLETIGGSKGTTILVTSRDEAVLSELKTHNNDPSKGPK